MPETLDARLAAAEQALQASESRFHSIIEKTSDSIIVVGQDGQVRFVNPAGEALLGRTAEALLGEPFGFPVLAGETFEIDVVRPGGETAVAEMRVVDTEWDGEPAYLASLRDITERVQMEKRLRFQAQLLGNVRESVVATDLEGTVIYWGQGAEALYGYTAEEALGRCITFIVEAEAQDDELARIQHVVELGVWRGQYEQRCADGSTFWADAQISLAHDADGAPFALISIDRDITERRRAQQALAKAHDDLERRVQERTAELASTNAALRMEIAERMRVEAALRTSEAKFRTIYDTAGAIILGHDLEGRVIYMNPYASRVLGYEVGELLGQPIAPLLEADEAQRATSIREQLLGDPDRVIEDFEQYYLRHDGGRILISWNVTGLKDGEGNTIGILGVGQDVTERKRVGQALQRAHDELEMRVQERTAELVEANRRLQQEIAERERVEAQTRYEASVNAAIADLARVLISTASLDEISYQVLEHAKSLTGSEFGYVGYIDPQTGYLVSSTMTRDIWDQCQVHEKAAVFKKFTGLWGWVLEQRQPLMSNVPSEDPRSSGVPDGHIPIRRFASAPALINDELVGQIALANPGRDYEARDLALVERLATLYALAIQRNQTEKAVQRSEALYRGIVHTMHDGVTLIEDGGVVFASRRASEIFGYPPEAYAQMSGLDFVASEDRERVERVMAEAQREGVLPTSLEFQIVTEAGERRYVRNRYAPIHESGGVVGRLVVSTDITERKQMQAQLQAYTEQLEQRVAAKVRELEEERAKTLQAAKLAALGEMATGVAHELNQPLTAMLFEADYLRTVARRARSSEEGVPLDLDELREIGENLAQDIDRSRHIIDHLRAFGRVSEGHVTSVNLNKPLEDSFILVGERLRLHGVEVCRSLAPDLPMIQADANRLEQVFLNLISNAEYAMEERAKALSEVGEAYAKVLEVSTWLEDGWAVAQISDNGIGIPAEKHARIFEPFFTTKPVGEGTGLGLSISYGIVNELEGEITFESVEGEGTTFTLRLPTNRRLH